MISELTEFASKDEKLPRARVQISQFAKRFPFRTDPRSIENLRDQDVYEKGSKDSFFYWVEYGTFDVGHITVWGASIFENVRKNLPALRRLLQIAADDSVRLSEKVDARWDTIRGLGGDKHIPKKIIALLYPEKVLPIFKTRHFEHFASELGLDLSHVTKQLFKKDYEDAKLGEKFEVLNNIFVRWREQNVPGVDNLALARFLYKKYPPPSLETVPDRAGVLGSTGLLFEPENELGVVSIFSIYHRELGFPFIVKIQREFPDAIVISDDGEPVAIEFEYKASTFIQHQHEAGSCDLVVCWVNDLPKEASIGTDVFALKEKLKDIIRNRFLEQHQTGRN